jgi:hypothetical protein
MPYYPQSPGFYPPLNSVTDAQLVDMPDGTVKGREIGSGVGDPANIGRALSFRNILGRNGGFEVWQRGAGGSASFNAIAGFTQYTADGWVFYSPNASHAVGQNPGLTTLVGGSRYSFAAQRNPGQTGTGQLTLEFPLDTDEIACARGSIVTLSFTAGAAANFSPAGGIVLCGVKTGTGTPVKRFVSGYTGDTDVIAGSAAVTTATVRYTFTSSIVVPAAAAQACVFFQWTPVGTAGAADFFWLDDVQLEIGSIATPFERRPFESELLACQRHFFKTFSYIVAPAQNVGAGDWQFPAGRAGAVATNYTAPFPVRMRAIPTIVPFNPAAANSFARDYDASGDVFVTNNLANDRSLRIGMVGAAGTAAGNTIGLHFTADAGI